MSDYDYKITLAYTKLKRALKALDLMASRPLDKDRGNVDATIQRFEFTIELFWKLLKILLESKGVEVLYPKDVLNAAYKGHLIEDEEAWLNMLKDRNLTSHTYDEKLADLIYERIKTYVPVFTKTLNSLVEKFDL
jgi:nucleotidyltransferase substrate binding protein (TIGR01987 family)